MLKTEHLLLVENELLWAVCPIPKENKWSHKQQTEIGSKCF